jgi:hypothetical protein
MNLRKNTYRKDELDIVAGQIYQLHFYNTTPNHFIVNSSINDVVYLSDTPNVGTSKYSKKINGISRQLYAEVNGILILYIQSASSGKVVIESYYTEFTENSISPTIETLDSTAPGTPKAEVISLTGGVVYDLKLTPGWVVSFGSGSVPNSEIKNNLTTVWNGDYIGGQPFYCDVNIKLYCTVNNTVSIVYL